MISEEDLQDDTRRLGRIKVLELLSFLYVVFEQDLSELERLVCY